MPKIIDGAREKILENAKKRLFENGYQHLSLREVAKESGIATGTIYNYFANKDYLIASIMLEDWEITLKKIDQVIEGASNVKEGVLNICGAIDEFCEIYAPVWKQPSVAAAATPDIGYRHEFLVKQLMEKVDQLLEREGYGDKKHFTALIAELMLSFNGKERIRKEFGVLLEQLYP